MTKIVIDKALLEQAIEAINAAVDSWGQAEIPTTRIYAVEDALRAVLARSAVEPRPVTPYTCPKCHALWLHWPSEQTGLATDTLNCRSAKWCDYCEKGGIEQLERLERVPARLRAPVCALYASPPAEPAVEPAGKLFHAKFNVGEHVWYMENNKPTEVVISAIEVFFVNTNQDRITYNAKNVTNSISWLDHTKLQEVWLFRTKAELLESL